jgi:hypothetical protein
MNYPEKIVFEPFEWFSFVMLNKDTQGNLTQIQIFKYNLN